MKLVLWMLLVALVVLWLIRGKKPSGVAQSDPRAEESIGGEAMVCCAHCGTHVPMSEAVVAPSGITFCSEEHQRYHGAI